MRRWPSSRCKVSRGRSGSAGAYTAVVIDGAGTILCGRQPERETGAQAGFAGISPPGSNRMLGPIPKTARSACTGPSVQRSLELLEGPILADYEQSSEDHIGGYISPYEDIGLTTVNLVETFESSPAGSVERAAAKKELAGDRRTDEQTERLAPWDPAGRLSFEPFLGGAVSRPAMVSHASVHVAFAVAALVRTPGDDIAHVSAAGDGLHVVGIARCSRPKFHVCSDERLLSHLGRGTGWRATGASARPIPGRCGLTTTPGACYKAVR
jgi:hypothetical protein